MEKNNSICSIRPLVGKITPADKMFVSFYYGHFVIVVQSPREIEANFLVAYSPP